MEKSYIEFEGVKYPTREIDVESVLDNAFRGYGAVTVADYELAKVLQERTDNFSVEDQGCNDIDNGIYCYMDSGVVASDSTDAELILDIIRQESTEGSITEQEWYNLMRLAGHEIALMHEKHLINIDVEGYEMGGTYSVYAYIKGGEQKSLYYGNSAKDAALAMLNAVTTVRIMLKSMNIDYTSVI